MANDLALLSPLQRKWDDRFALDLAMTLEGSGSALPELLKAYNYTQEELEVFCAEPLFAQKVEHLRTQLKERGFTFKLKAQMQAEELLDTSWDIIHTTDVSPAVKADLIKWTAKIAGLEPTKESSVGDQGVKINIIMGDASMAPPPGVRVIDND